MQFTPQQLTGGPRFGSNCRIGNWSEDMELEQIKLKDFLKKKEKGQLLVIEKQASLELSLQPSALTKTEDGILRFGNQVMFSNHQAEAFLAANAQEKLPKPSTAIAVTSTPNSNPCVRNVFTLVRAEQDDGFDGDELHYGQTVRLVSNVIEFPLYLHSEPVSPLAASKYSRNCEVTLYAKATGGTLWKLLHPDTKLRFESEGDLVRGNTSYVIQHVHTGSFLSSDKITYQTIFGPEFEVCCKACLSTNKTQNLIAERRGDITGDYALRRHGGPNIWTVCTGDAEQ